MGQRVCKLYYPGPVLSWLPVGYANCVTGGNQHTRGKGKFPASGSHNGWWLWLEQQGGVTLDYTAQQTQSLSGGLSSDQGNTSSVDPRLTVSSSAARCICSWVPAPWGIGSLRSFSVISSFFYFVLPVPTLMCSSRPSHTLAISCIKLSVWNI